MAEAHARARTGSNSCKFQFVIYRLSIIYLCQFCSKSVDTSQIHVYFGLHAKFLAVSIFFFDRDYGGPITGQPEHILTEPVCYKPEKKRQGVRSKHKRSKCEKGDYHPVRCAAPPARQHYFSLILSSTSS